MAVKWFISLDTNSNLYSYKQKDRSIDDKVWEKKEQKKEEDTFIDVSS